MSLKKILSDIYNITFVNMNILECGAYCYRDLITSEFISDNNCWYLEPNPDDFVHLKKHLNQCLEYALSDFDGEIEFNQTSWGGNGSIEHSNIHLEELKSYNASFSKIKVKTITYDTLLDTVNCIFDIFCLDVEGHEVTILNSIKKISNEKLPKIIVIECGYNWEDRLKILESMNYSIDIYWKNNCILSRIDSNLDKNFEKIDYYNNIYKEFFWFGRVIYKNSLSK